MNVKFERPFYAPGQIWFDVPWNILAFKIVPLPFQLESIIFDCLSKNVDDIESLLIILRHDECKTAIIEQFKAETAPVANFPSFLFLTNNMNT